MPFLAFAVAMLAALVLRPSLVQAQAPAAAAMAASGADRPVVMIVPAPPGGAGDIVARIVARSLSAAMRKPVAVRNQPAQAGVEAINAIVESVGGELRLGFALSTAIVAGRLLPRGARFNPIDDLEWIGVVATYPSAIVVADTNPAYSFADWLARVPSAGRAIRYGSSPAGSTSDLAMRHVAAALGAPFQYVFYADRDAGYRDLTAGRIDVFSDGLPNAVEEAPRMHARILAVSSDRRTERLPDVPAFGEHWPRESFEIFTGLVVSRREPANVRAQVADAWRAVVADRGVAAEVGRAGARWRGLAGDEARDYVEREFVRHAAQLARLMPADAARSE